MGSTITEKNLTMCEKGSNQRSCTTCPKYDGMKCTAADMLMGDREQVLQQEHRRGFICLDTGEAELKGDAVLQWTAEQERLRQEKGYKSCEEMWDAEGKQVKSGVHIDEDNEHLEPILQISNEPGSPSSECPSLREGPPQKGKIGQNMVQYTANRQAAMRDPDGTCDKCSHCQDGYCYQWHMQIRMPHIPCGYWSLGKNKADWCIATQDTESPLSTCVDNASLPPGRIIAGSDLQYVENPPPLFTRDPNGYWEPVRPRSCTNCKSYNDPICMKIGTHIGNRAQIWQREDLNGFQCIAALPKPERDNIITSYGCNKKEIR